MIRINLLGAPKPKNKRSAVSVPNVMEMGEPGSPKVKILVILVAVAALNMGQYYRLDRQAKTIAKNMDVAEQKNRELAEVKAKYL